MLPTPGFHHLHLNSVDPDAAIGFYTRQFPSTSKGSWGGLPALLSPNNVMLLFNTVARPPAMSKPSAIWHFGWHVRDVRGNIAVYKTRPEVKLLPLYDGRRRLCPDQQRYLARAQRRRSWAYPGTDRGGEGAERATGGRRRVCLYGGAGRRAG
jgi:hypothetical protein